MSHAKDTVHVGFEVGTGKPIRAPMGHMVVFGQTQRAGKTTALEGMISRAGVRALAFRTKRGERGFESGRRIAPYFEERTDWQFVQAILEAQLRSKQDFKQRWIMEACEGATSLEGVQRNVRRLKDSTKDRLAKDIYYVLDHYFALVVPQIASLPKSPRLDLGPGLNVMDLTAYNESPELQSLVIRSAIAWVHRKEEGVTVVIPEAWRFVPAQKNSPVKMAAEELSREGGGLRNFMLFDCQDMVGLDTLFRRAARVWLIGVQREQNEIGRGLQSVPAGFGRPKAAEVATLKLGQFYACWDEHAHKVYAQPAWMDEATARAVAMGESPLPDAPLQKPRAAEVAQAVRRQVTDKERGIKLPPHESEDDEMAKEDIDRIEGAITALAGEVKKMSGRHVPAVAPSLAPAPNGQAGFDEDGMYERFKARLLTEAESEPEIIRLLAARTTLEVEKVEKVLEVKDDTPQGKFLMLIADGFFDEPKAVKDAFAELRRRGGSWAPPTVSNFARSFAADGLLSVEGGGKGTKYLKAPGLKIKVKK
jgi:hypothetical protein